MKITKQYYNSTGHLTNNIILFYIKMYKEATRYTIFVNQSMTNQMLNILEFYEWLIAIDLLWSCFQNIVNIRYGFTSAQNI